MYVAAVSLVWSSRRTKETFRVARFPATGIGRAGWEGQGLAGRARRFWASVTAADVSPPGSAASAAILPVGLYPQGAIAASGSGRLGGVWWRSLRGNSGVRVARLAG
jgi:hypothetical protein